MVALTPATASALRNAVSVVVLVITAMRLPASAATVAGASLPARTSALPPSTKMGTEKSTRSMRDSVIVVLPHSASILRATTSSMRVSLSTGFQVTLRFAMPSERPTAAATFSHSSTE